MTTPDDPQFWPEHGIDPDIARERPYERWRNDDLRPIRKEYPDYIFSSGQRAFLTKVAKQSDGLLIHRAPPETALFGNYGHIFPELRPDNAVVTSIKKHWHGQNPEVKKRLDLPDFQIYDYKLLDDHIKRDKDPHENRKDGEEYLGDHFGVNTEEVHKHRHLAKYLFPPSGSYEELKTHKHSGMNPKVLEVHIDKKHKGETPDQLTGAHNNYHWHAKKLKDRRRNYAARIDIHPLCTTEMFKRSDVVFFALEGCIKSDAILSAGAPVVSVPSVTLWDTPELADPAFRDKYLAGKTIVIVPDADWRDWKKNEGAVIKQARFLQTTLKYHGLKAVVAAPPEDVYRHNRKIKGVDDFLGSLHGGNLDDLEVVEHILPMDRIENLVMDLHYGHKDKPRTDAIARDIAVLVALVSHSLGGKIQAPFSTLARIVGLQGRAPKWPVLLRSLLADPDELKKETDKAADRVKDAIKSLKSLSIVEVDEDHLALEINYYSYMMDWLKRPTITIAEEFRGEIRKTRLGSYLPIAYM
jgi:hypothetical protein